MCFRHLACAALLAAGLAGCAQNSHRYDRGYPAVRDRCTGEPLPRNAEESFYWGYPRAQGDGPTGAYTNRD